LISNRRSARGWIVRVRWIGLASAMFGAIACVPPQGGWDVDVLRRGEPGVELPRGHRLGDLLPFPALDGRSVALVVCRFAEREIVHVHGSGPGWSRDWARAAVRAVDRSVSNLSLRLDPDAGSAAGSQIEILSIGDVEGPGPKGLGDTISECDVSRGSGSDRPYRGLLVGAEIRIRRAQIDHTNQLREALAQEWVGALMHEIAHALGFAGHAAIGDTVLVREETSLRAAGRRALAGESRPDATLDALYTLGPGRVLGMRDIHSDGLVWLERVAALRRARAEAGVEQIGVYSSAGDRAARIVWRYADGSQIGLRMPTWKTDLTRGRAIRLRPDAVTLRALAGSVE
jgi:hypothetical protein